ncbi:adenylosuccinate synthase [Marispirochaeta aestuarii]|uniref:Adenylosuccinate synthetase n=1 Tax=Marispirochaeta aestuarii TaxID=1963862 RepID=A0A1Y1S1C8_9SPIO|nr:adenylosuccinate synthase [Marispirochaeta aestuarii]ORC37308.1 adenylosuccinate synthase [Marispirochaeta aestuarii]
MNLVVIGAQWGDEGKGKLVDYMAGNAQVVVRFSGGANAGHTIVIGDTTYKLHLIPSGVISKDKIAVLGSGMVIDPEALFSELEMIESQGVDWEGRVLISDRAHLVLPRYKTMDLEMEKDRRLPIGTTGRGIGVAYAEKAQREGVRAGDLWDSRVWNSLLPGDREFLEPFRKRLEGMVINLAAFMAKHKKSNILFEGAQGILLDLDTGTYPFVSSGYSNAAGAALGGGIGPRNLDKILGVFKAYSTRVGNGPFPSEFAPEEHGGLIDLVRETGREYGVTTGRPRRCGYLDLVALKYACRTNSIDALVLTHLDVYDTLKTVTLCTAYEIDGKKVTDFPSRIEDLEKAVPVTKDFPGWQQNLGDIKEYQDLPWEAREYIRFIEEYTETPVTIVSVGYERTQTILREDPWIRS